MKTKIISSFKERPATRIAWWAFGLGMAVLAWQLFLVLFTSLIRPWLSQSGSTLASPAFGIGMGVPAILFTLGALVCAIIALRKGERSWVVWAGLVPAVMFITMLIADLIFAVTG